VLSEPVQRVQDAAVGVASQETGYFAAGQGTAGADEDTQDSGVQSRAKGGVGTGDIHLFKISSIWLVIPPFVRDTVHRFLLSPMQ
jgi:hypothetical protein